MANKKSKKKEEIIIQEGNAEEYRNYEYEQEVEENG